MAQQISGTSFLDLPAEIRNAIYHLYLTDVFPEDSMTVYWKDLTCWYKSLSQTRREIRKELHSMLGPYISRMNLVVKVEADIVSTFVAFLEELPEPAISAIGSISLQFPCYFDRHFKTEYSLVYKVEYSRATSKFQLIDQCGFEGPHTTDCVIILDYETPRTVTVCPTSQASFTTADVEEVARLDMRLMKVLFSIDHYDSIHEIEMVRCPPTLKALPLFLRPIIDSWEGKTFTKAGLKKLIKLLEAEFSNKLDNSSSSDEESESQVRSLKVRLPIKRAGFLQMFPWGVKVDNEQNDFGKSMRRKRSWAP